MPLNCQRNLLTVLTVGGALLGAALGFILRSIPRDTWWTPREILYIQFPGELYLRLLNMFILPLLVSAVISGIASLNLQASRRVAVSFAIWSLVTEYLAVVTGILLAIIVRPGVGALIKPLKKDTINDLLAVDTALDVFRNVFPPNYVRASLGQERTILIRNESIPIEEWVIQISQVPGVNIPGLITLAISLGLALAASRNSGLALLEFADTLSKAMMMALGWVLWSTPIAVISIVAAKCLEEKVLAELLERLGLYFVTVLIGLFIHSIIVLPTLYFGVTRQSPFKLYASVSQALATAFGTASSSATLPVTMDCLEHRGRLDQRVVRFMTPVCSVINQDGTALYEAVAAVFIAQIHGLSLGVASIFLISVTVTAACLGGAGVPQAGLVTMVLILSSLGLPAEDVTLIVAVDWLLDRFRTTVNVASDCLAIGVVEHFSKNSMNDIKDKSYAEVPQEEIEEYELNVRL